MRGDYPVRYADLLQNGLKRLTTEGAWYKNAAYPYLNTITCAGHSTIGTGAFPYRHGMVLNTWWDRATSRPRACTADSTVKNIGYSGTASGGDSAASLRLPTLADEVRERAQGRIVAMSLKPRSAITLSGSHPTSVVWFDDRAGWATSTAFTAEKLPWLFDFIQSRPASRDVGAVWDRLLPAAQYSGPDAGTGERSPQGWTTTFPHALGNTPGSEFNLQWQRSPFADESLERMAVAAIDGALIPFFGPGKYGVYSGYTDIYLAPGILDKLTTNERAAAAMFAGLGELPGIARAFFADEISGAEARTSTDPIKRAAALSY